MLDTSNQYKTMIAGREIHDRIVVTISNGSETLTLRNKDIVKGSLSVNWRGSNNSNLSLGACYSSEMSFTAIQSMENQIIGEVLTVTATLYYDLGNNTEEAIPLGTFYCDKPVVYSKTTAYTCYDAMQFFDIRIDTRSSATPYNMLAYICSKCGMVLGNSQLEIANMANGTQLVVVDPQYISTYRDALACISAILGGYCQIGRDNKLYIRRFHKTSDANLARKRRESTAFSGYKTCFAGVKASFLADQKYYGYEYIDEEAQGLVIDLGDIPIIEDTPEKKHLILQNVYTNSLAGLEYYPCEISMPGDASFEPGDMINTPDRYGDMRSILLTSVTFVWRASSSIVSEGSDPKLDKVTTAEKRNIQRAKQTENVSEVVTATYANAANISVSSSDTLVTSLRFTTNKNLTAIFGAELPLYSTGDGLLTITYENNGIEGDTVTARLHEGYNLVTLVNHLHYEESLVILLTLQAKTQGINGGTAPTVTFSRDTIRSYIFAQGISVEEGWDGIITIAEDVSYVTTVMAMYGLTESVSVTTYLPVVSTLTEVVSFVVGSVQQISINDTMSLTLEYGDQILRMGMGHRAGAGRMLAPLITGGN